MDRISKKKMKIAVKMTVLGQQVGYSIWAKTANMTAGVMSGYRDKDGDANCLVVCICFLTIKSY